MAHCGAAIIHDIHFPGLNMKLTGRCYCGDIQYEFEGEVQGSLQCHCRESILARVVVSTSCAAARADNTPVSSAITTIWNSSVFNQCGNIFNSKWGRPAVAVACIIRVPGHCRTNIAVEQAD